MGTEDSDYYGKKVHECIRLLIEDESVRSNNSRQANVTIYMVPDTLRNLNPTAYTPRITSIGPLHKQDQRLKAMEDHKVTYMHRLFCRTAEHRQSTKEGIGYECVQAVLERLTGVRACYAPSLTNYEDFKLAKMMIIDGCFILELLYMSECGICEGDPIFDNILVIRDVKHDLLLLENQMPFFILEKLFSITITMMPILMSVPLTNLIFHFFNDMNILNNCELTTMNILNNCELTTEGGIVDHRHILGLLQSCYGPAPTASKRGIDPNISYSATEFAGAGVTFKANYKKQNEWPTDMCAQTDEIEDYDLLAVKFKQSPLIPGLGTLFVRKTCFEIPKLCIKDSNLSFFRNLIAYEQCYPLSRHYVTSFAFLMGRLIDTKDDALLLVRSKVIHHELGAIEDVTNLFNNICSGVVLRDFYYTQEWKQLDDYCNRFWPRILILLRRAYVKFLTGAVILFVLTLIQTIYTVGM